MPLSTELSLALLLLFAVGSSSAGFFSTRFSHHGMHPFGFGVDLPGFGMKLPTYPHMAQSVFPRRREQPHLSAEENEVAYVLTATIPHHNRRFVSVELLKSRDQISIHDYASNFHKTLQLPHDIISDRITTQWVRNELVTTLPKAQNQDARQQKQHNHLQRGILAERQQKQHNHLQRGILAEYPGYSHTTADGASCSCDVGCQASADGSRCVVASTTEQCPPHIHMHGPHGSCVCAYDDGYELSTDGLQCVPVLQPQQQHHHHQHYQDHQQHQQAEPNGQHNQQQSETDHESADIFVEDDGGELFNIFEKDPHATHGYIDIRGTFHEY